MDTKLATRRRVLVAAYARYQAADRNWTQALNTAAALVPDVVEHGVWRIGAPRSKLRRLYVERDHALRRMMVAKSKLESAKVRLRNRRSGVVLLIS